MTDTPSKVKLPDFPSNPDDVIEYGLLQSNIFYLNGEIDEDNISKAIKWILYCNSPNVRRKIPYLTLYVNSVGGDLYETFALIDIMKASKIPIRTVGLGNVCSGGFLIFSSGEHGHRVIHRNTSIMSHQFASGISGKHHDLKSNYKELELSNERMVRLLCENTGLDARTVKKKFLPTSDVWFTAEELVEVGIADKVG